MVQYAFLVGALEHFLFFHILGIIIIHLTNSYFSEGWLNHQPVFVYCTSLFSHLGVSENVVYPFLPNGFADHYPY